jgi:hypothetical protein
VGGRSVAARPWVSTQRNGTKEIDSQIQSDTPKPIDIQAEANPHPENHEPTGSPKKYKQTAKL